MKKINWKAVKWLFFYAQIIVPLLVAEWAYWIDGESFIKVYREGLFTCFVILLFIFYLPLLFYIIKQYWKPS